MCNCIDKKNALLMKEGMTLEVALASPAERTVIKVVPLSRTTSARNTAGCIVATFCPFCGERYAGEDSRADIQAA